MIHATVKFNFSIALPFISLMALTDPHSSPPSTEEPSFKSCTSAHFLRDGGRGRGVECWSRTVCQQTGLIHILSCELFSPCAKSMVHRTSLISQIDQGSMVLKSQCALHYMIEFINPMVLIFEKDEMVMKRMMNERIRIIFAAPKLASNIKRQDVI